MATSKKSPAPKPGRPATAPTRDRSGALYVLLDPEMLAGMDRWIEALNADNTGPQWTRTALVRAMVTRGLRDRASKGEAP